MTDQDIDKAWRSQNYTADYDTFRMAVGRAIEAAATAPLLAKIAELEALAESEGSRSVEYLRRARAAEAKLAQRVPEKVTEDMHIAAVKVLHRASGVDGLPQRMLDAMRAAAPAAPEQQEPEPQANADYCRYGVCAPGEPHAPGCSEYTAEELSIARRDSR